jgi:hypothetical protein
VRIQISFQYVGIAARYGACRAALHGAAAISAAYTWISMLYLA